MRYGAAVGLAVLLILAGCQGAPSTDGGKPETIGEEPPVRSPTGTTNATAHSVSIASFPYPPGASPAGLDPSTLPATHHEALLAAERYALKQFQKSGNLTDEARFSVDHARQRSQGERRIEGGERDRSIDLYASGDTLYQRTGEPVGNGSFFGNYREREQTWSSARWTARPTIAAILDTYHFEAERVLTRNGTQLLRYRSTGVRGGANGTPTNLPSNETVTIDIDERGIVRSMELDRNSSRQIHLSISDVATASAQRPEWVDVAAGPPSIAVPNATLSATEQTVELETANHSVRTTAVVIHHDGGESLDVSELIVTAGRSRVYDLRNLTSSNATLSPIRPFEPVGSSFDPGESVRVIHTVSPRLYSGDVTLTEGGIEIAGRDGQRRFPSIQNDHLIQGDQSVRVFWNRSRPQTVLTYTVGSSRTNTTTTDGR
jgi:hypothetical protein